MLAAAAGEFDERGYAQTAVSHISSRARVSRRTFYELFSGREACLVAVCDEILELIQAELDSAGVMGLPWRERMRAGLGVVLSVLDREPALARVCVTQTLQGGSMALGWRQQVIERLAATVDEGRLQSARGANLSALTAEGLVGAVLAIVQGRLMRPEPSALSALVGDLTGMIVLPYLGASAAHREQQRPAGTPAPLTKARSAASRATDPLDGVAMRFTYRTVRILEGSDEHPGASNRALADLAGIHDQGQVSKLLSRLERLGLVTNHGGHSKGEPNAWSLTLKGKQLVHGLGGQRTRPRRVAS